MPGLRRVIVLEHIRNKGDYKILAIRENVAWWHANVGKRFKASLSGNFDGIYVGNNGIEKSSHAVSESTNSGGISSITDFISLYENGPTRSFVFLSGRTKDINYSLGTDHNSKVIGTKLNHRPLQLLPDMSTRRSSFDQERFAESQLFLAYLSLIGHITDYGAESSNTTFAATLISNLSQLDFFGTNILRILHWIILDLENHCALLGLAKFDSGRLEVQLLTAWIYIQNVLESFPNVPRPQLPGGQAPP